MAKQSNVRKMPKKPLNLNIGVILFGIILFYVIYIVYAYFQTEHIVRYQVKNGSLAANHTYTGIIVRTEEAVGAGSAGYLNYYAGEGERVAKNNLVYLIDETGELNSLTSDTNLGENSLSEKQLTEFRSEIINFVHSYDIENYSNVYDFKTSLQNTVSKLANVSLLENIDELASDLSSTSIITYYYAPLTGIVAYWYDGYETLEADNVTQKILDQTDYTKTYMTNSTMVAAGDFAYKLLTDEDWSIVISVDEEEGQALVEEGYVKVRFLKNQYESWGEVRLFTGADGGTYVELSFTNSMITFVSERFLDVELILEDESGLKIPVSAIVEKYFFTIPEEYVYTSSSSVGQLLRRTYLEDGTLSTEVVEASLYYHDEDKAVYYVDMSILNVGDILCKENGTETFTVYAQDALMGVYNMNKGYADFTHISVLYENEEYAIVKAYSTYGLSVYDYIVLNADAVTDGQLLSQ